MGFVNWLNYKKYFTKGTDAEVARIGHVNAAYKAAIDKPKVDSLNTLQGNLQLSSVAATVRGGSDWAVSIENSLETVGNINFSIAKPYSSLYMIVTPGVEPSVSVVYTDITSELFSPTVSKFSTGFYIVNLGSIQFDVNLSFMNVYMNTSVKHVITQQFTGSDLAFITFEGSPSGSLSPADFNDPVFIELKMFQ